MFELEDSTDAEIAEISKNAVEDGEFIFFGGNGRKEENTEGGASVGISLTMATGQSLPWPELPQLLTIPSSNNDAHLDFGDSGGPATKKTSSRLSDLGVRR